MLLHGFLSAVLGKTKHRPVKLKSIQLIGILMCIATIPEIAYAAKFDSKAVFSSPCTDLMTLNTPVPELTALTVCTYIKLTSSNPWTAFTYRLPTSSNNVYEFGILGDSSSLKIWMFGTQINVFERLNLHTWYEICVIWDGKNESMEFYLNGTLKVHRKLENKTNLVGGGTVILGCSHFKEINASVSVGLVGEMYMFRMWNTSQTSLFQKCNDGNVIKWKMDDWIYISHVVQQDSTLYCAKEQSEAPTSGHINNNIHMFHKRSLGGPTTVVQPVQETVDSSSALPGIPLTNGPTTALSGNSTQAVQVDSTVSNTMTSDFNTFSTKETTNVTNVSEFTIGTSKNSTLWKSSLNTNVNNGTDTFSNSSTFSTSSVTTNINNGSSSWSTYFTSEFSQIPNVLSNETSTTTFSTVSSNVTAGSMNCSINDTNAFQNWQSDICNATTGYGTAYEIILKANCALAVNLLKSFMDTEAKNYSIITKSCMALIFGIDDTVICGILNQNTQRIQQFLQGLNKIDYYCCCLEGSLFPNCISSAPACAGSGGSVTLGFQSTAFDNTGLTFSGPSATSTKGSSATFNSGSITTLDIVSNATVDAGLSTTIDGKSNTTIKREVTLTVNSKSETTLNSGSNETNNLGIATTINSEFNTTGNIEITAINRDPNGTVNTSYTTVNRGPLTTIDSGTRTTVNNGPLTTVNNVINTTVNNGPTGTTNSGSKSTVNGGPMTSINNVLNTTANNGPTGTTNSGSNSTVSGGPVTSINNVLNTTANNGPTGTTNRGSNSTVSGGPMTSINNGLNTTANHGPTRTSTPNATVNTGPMSTFHSGSETTRNNNSIIITNVSGGSYNTTTSPNTTDILKNLTGILGSDNLNSSTVNSIVSQLENLLTGEVNSDDAKTLLDVLNSFLNVSQTLLGPVSNRLIKIVDTIGLQLTFPGQSIALTTQSLALAVNKVNDTSFTGTSFGVDSSSSGLQVSLGSQATTNTDESILLPASLINDLSSGDKQIASRVQFNFYAKTSFFKDSFLSTQKQLVSKVISSSVANLSVTNLSENITVTLKTSSTNDSNGVECVFWDFNKNNGSGGWSSFGCLVANTTQSETVCKCNHLTSFAVLMNVSPNDQLQPKDLLVLTFITYIGCGLSAIFLSVTLITYIAFEKIRRDYPSKILIQLCAALVCLNLTFLLNSWIALYNDIPGLCISVAAFLHYFVMVSITWMGLEAFHMYLSLVKVFNTYVRKYILKFCIIGWGVPAVVVAIILAVNKDLYSLRISGTYPNGSADYFCWVDDIVFWITIVGYFAIIFLLNVSMFVVVLIQLCRIKRQKQLGYQRKTTLQDLRSVAGITFLLGITWGLGFFSFGPGRTAIMYLFTIFNSLQGFFIFFFYCVAKENVRKQWRRYLCCGKLRLAENSDWSKTATNKLRKQTSKQGVSSSSSNSIQSSSNTNSTSLLVSNEYSLHPNGNGNVLKERNGVTFILQNGEMPLQEFAGRPATKNGDVQQNSVRRTSNRGSVHFIDQI